MPECGVALFADAGFALVSTRMSQPSVGTFLALTGTRVANPGDLLTTSLGTHYVPSDAVDALADDFIGKDWVLAQGECNGSIDAAVRKALDAFAEDVRTEAHAKRRKKYRQLYGGVCLLVYVFI